MYILQLLLHFNSALYNILLASIWYLYTCTCTCNSSIVSVFALMYFPLYIVSFGRGKGS